MIDLFSVKFNGEYDDIGATPTITDGLFLCDTTGDNYTRGYSYQITDGNATRLNAVDDYKIQNAIYPAIQNVCEWLNNWFILPKSKDRFLSPFSYLYKDVIKTGDLVKAFGSGNLFVSYATVNNDEITLDNVLFDVDVVYKMEVMHLPQDVEKAISSMIYYDVYTRGTVTDIKSENIGNYSYNRETVYVGSLAYPKALVSGLEACYKKVRFVQ